MKDTEDRGVSGVQARLQNLGFDPGKVDGVLGPRTRAAIRTFQRSMGIEEPDGKITDALFDQLEKEHGA
jgi:peptidoglycan hydrolase-like protein with peptidoglycan-binding domain